MITPDLRGHGHSAMEPPWDLERQVADVLAVPAGRGLTRVDVMGHSYGARVATRLSRTTPERIDRLALLDPSVQLPAQPVGEQARRGMSLPPYDTPEHARAERAAAWPFASGQTLDDEVEEQLEQGPGGRWCRRLEAAAVATACSGMARPQILPSPTADTLLMIVRRSASYAPSTSPTAAAYSAANRPSPRWTRTPCCTPRTTRPDLVGPLLHRFLTRRDAPPVPGGSGRVTEPAPAGSPAFPRLP